jgi:hypothetical protein
LSNVAGVASVAGLLFLQKIKGLALRWMQNEKFVGRLNRATDTLWSMYNTAATVFIL